MPELCLDAVRCLKSVMHIELIQETHIELKTVVNKPILKEPSTNSKGAFKLIGSLSFGAFQEEASFLFLFDQARNRKKTSYN